MASPARVLVVDDEPLARRGLARALAEHPEATLLAECGNGREAVEAIRTLAPDLVLLDVEMPELDGFGVVHAIGHDRMPPVIFVTAFDRYAVQAFEAHAIDYVLKPVDPERLEQALQRALSALRAKASHALHDQFGSQLGNLLARMEEREAYARRLVVKEAGRIHFVATTEVDWIEAADNYTRLHVGGRILLQRETLSSLAERLDPAQFVRIHRSTIVRFDRVRELRPVARGDCTLLLSDGTSLSVSRRYRAQLDKLMRGL